MISRLDQIALVALLVATAAGFSANAQQAVQQQSETKTVTYSYDSNHDGFVEPDEFTTYLYSRSDLDGDGFLGDEEWKVSTGQWYRPYSDINTNTYEYWDQDKNGRLDSNEVKTLVQKTGLYSKWDTNVDGKVDSEEFARGTFRSYDDNSDNMLSVDEWKIVLR